MKKWLQRIGLSIFFCASIVAAPFYVELNKTAILKTPVIYLGDIFKGLPKNLHEKPIGMTPPPGKQAVFDNAWLRAVSRQYNLTWEESQVIDRVTVERACDRIETKFLSERLEHALKPYVHNRDFRVRFETSFEGVLVIEGTPQEFTVENIHYRKATGHFKANLVFPKVKKPQTISGYVVEYIQIPTAARPLAKEHIIRKNDIEWQKVELKKVSDNIASSFDQLIGMEAKYSLKPGMPIKMNEIHRPLFVKKGAIVALTYSAGKINLSTKAKALESACYGESVRVQNIKTRRTVTGIVKDLNHVETYSNEVAVCQK